MADEIGAASYKGYTDGGDFLLEIDGKCVGHCTEHSIKYATETKDRQVKAAKTVTTLGSSKFKEVSVTGLSVTGTASGYIYSGEEELDIAAIREAWKAGRPVKARGFRRDNAAQPSFSSDIIITDFEEKYPKGEDATFDLSFQNTGEVTLDTD